MGDAVIVVVTGPPCSGKSTYVREHATDGDVRVDLDDLAAALGHPGTGIVWDRDHPARRAARTARIAVIDAALATPTRAHTTWIIDTMPGPVALRRYRDAGARLVPLDPGAEVCRHRANERDDPAGTIQQIDRWYADHG